MIPGLVALLALAALARADESPACRVQAVFVKPGVVGSALWIGVTDARTLEDCVAAARSLSLRDDGGEELTRGRFEFESGPDTVTGLVGPQD